MIRYASMEPPPIGGGNILQALQTKAISQASMEPPPIGGGNAGEVMWVGQDNPALQWSRLQSEAVIMTGSTRRPTSSCFNGAASNRRR